MPTECQLPQPSLAQEVCCFVKGVGIGSDLGIVPAALVHRQLNCLKTVKPAFCCSLSSCSTPVSITCQIKHKTTLPVNMSQRAFYMTLATCLHKEKGTVIHSLQDFFNTRHLKKILAGIQNIVTIFADTGKKIM